MADDAEEAGEAEEERLEEEEEDAEEGTKVVEEPLDPPKYEVRPDLGEKFQAEAVREIILQSMQQQLIGRQYRADQAPSWAQKISNGVRQRVMELGMKRYKFVVQSTLFEMKGAGINCGQRMIWDPETDAYTADMFRNDSLICFTIVYGLYMY